MGQVSGPCHSHDGLALDAVGCLGYMGNDAPEGALPHSLVSPPLRINYFKAALDKI